MINSPFLFDNREEFLYGGVVIQDVEYIDNDLIESLRTLRQRSLNYLMSSIVMVSIGATAFIHSRVASSPAHIVIRSGAKVDKYVEDDLRKNFIESRDFLGLKQGQVAKILDLSESTIEKFEQGVYPTQATKTKELVTLFNDWVSVLKEFHGDRKFIVRPFIRVKMNALGEKSPIEYALENPGEGLYDLIGLERKMYG